MDLYKIPLQGIPNQQLTFSQGGQKWEITLMTRQHEHLYMSLAVDGVAIFHNRLCRNGERMIDVDYLQNQGNLVFVDLQGSCDPHYAELGSRYVLAWVNDE